MDEKSVIALRWKQAGGEIRYAALIETMQVLQALFAKGWKYYRGSEDVSKGVVKFKRIGQWTR